MSSITLGPRTFSPEGGGCPSAGSLAPTRDGSSRSIDASGLGREDEASPLRVLSGEVVAYPALLGGAISLYVALIAPPLVALLPIAAAVLLLRAVGAFFGGIS